MKLSDLTNEEKKKRIEKNFKEIMITLGLDMNNDSLKHTPNRVAKMYVDEVFSGLNPNNKPEVKLFDNEYKYDEMVVIKDITLYSFCEHHFMPMIGKAHIAYFPNNKVIGLSKINRIVQYFAKRPQLQERLTVEIAENLREVLCIENVAITIKAEHLCVAARGIKDIQSSTVTSKYLGIFQADNIKKEFLNRIK